MHHIRQVADRTTLSGMAVQHADNGYVRCWNFDSSLMHSIFLMYSPDDANVYGSRGGDRVSVGVESWLYDRLTWKMQLFKFCINN